MTLYNPHLFETDDGTQFLPPRPSATPEGWTVPPAFRALPGDPFYGVPVNYPGPNGWGITQFLRLQSRILDPVEFTNFQQGTIRELLARTIPLIDVGNEFPVTAYDIRTKTRNYHKRGSASMMFGEYVIQDEGTGREKVLMLNLDLSYAGLLTIFSEECHRDCLPNHPVTYRDYLMSQEKAALTRKEAALKADIPCDIVEGSPEWANWMALQETEQMLFTLRRRLARVVSANADRLIPPRIHKSAPMKAAYDAYLAAEPGQHIPSPDRC